MDCCCGENTIINLPVPVADKGNGDAVDASGLQAKKTIELSGSYDGSYSILASHDGNLFFPVAYFDSGAGAQSVRRTVEVVVSLLMVHREAPISDLVTVNVAGRAAIVCVPTLGQTLKPNQFLTLATLPPGASGPQPAIDLFIAPHFSLPYMGLDTPNVACGGSFTGQISVEGSLDGRNFSPLGGFLSSQTQPGASPGQLIFDPLMINDVVRFVRVNVLPGTIVTGPTSLTLGGHQNCDCTDS
jgi:hypothetical protein